jgi:hypothetical protein
MRISGIEKKVLTTKITKLGLVLKQHPFPEQESIDGYITTENFCLVGNEGFCMWVHGVTITCTQDELDMLTENINTFLDVDSWAIIPKISSDNNISIELIIEFTKDEFGVEHKEHLIKIGNRVACRYPADSESAPFSSLLYNLELQEDNERDMTSNQFHILAKLSKDDISYTQAEANGKIADIYNINSNLFYFRMSDTPAYRKSNARLLKSFVKLSDEQEAETETGEELCPIAELPAVTSVE